VGKLKKKCFSEEEIDKYIHSELSFEEKYKLEKHLEVCNKCKMTYLKIKKSEEIINSSLFETPDNDYFDNMKQRILSKIEERSQKGKTQKDSIK